MDPVRNPYAPGAGQRPPELAGRDGELEAFEVMLTRVGRGRPERSIVLTGLRGVGKTVLLNTLRSQAVRRGWGTGKVEARPEQSLRRPLAAALHLAVRELSAPASETEHVLGVLKSFALRHNSSDTKVRDRWQPGIDAPVVAGRADSGDIEIDLVELLVDIGGLAGDCGRGVAVFIDEMQDLGTEDVSALCAAAHEISQTGLPFVVVGAGLPHLPAVLSASKSYSERLFRYARIDRLDRRGRGPRPHRPGQGGGRRVHPRGAGGDVRGDGGLPVLRPGVRQDGVGRRHPQPGHRRRRPGRGPDRRGRAGGRVLRLALRAGDPGRAGVPARHGRRARRPREPVGTDGPPRADGDEGVPTAAVAALLGAQAAVGVARRGTPSSRRGWSTAPSAGRIAFSVPHFGRYLRRQDV